MELVPLLKEMPTGKPRKDPSTGYLMNHSLPSTDVTKKADVNRSDTYCSAFSPTLMSFNNSLLQCCDVLSLSKF